MGFGPARYTDNSIEFGKAWRSFLESLYADTKQIGKQVGLLRGQYAEWRKAPLQYHLSAKTFKISYLMGRRHMRDVVETTWRTSHSIWFTGWVFTLSLRKTSQESINLERVLLGLILGYALYAGGIWKGDILVAAIEELGHDGRIGKSTRKDSVRKRWYFPKKKGEFIFPIADGTNQTPWRRSRLENIHLDTAATNSRRKSPWFSWRIKKVSSTTSRLTSGCQWSGKWILVHVMKLHIPPSRWTKSQTLLAEKIIPYSVEIHWRLQNYTYILGC